MGLPLRTVDKLEAIHRRHKREYGKIIQKLLALSFLEIGYRVAEERAVQGVDIDVLRAETGERLTLEVKTSRSESVNVGDKDLEGLASRREADGYEPYFAFLFHPYSLMVGWMIVPVGEVRKGNNHAIRLASKNASPLSDRINEAFVKVVERTYEDLFTSPTGSALATLRRKYHI